MAFNYNEIEELLNNIDKIENWSDKIIKIKEIKGLIDNKTQHLKNMFNTLLQDNINFDIGKEYVLNMDIDNELVKFHQMETIDDKLKQYYIISTYIDELEKELFN